MFKFMRGSSHASNHFFTPSNSPTEAAEIMICRNVREDGLDARICTLLILIKANIHCFSGFKWVWPIIFFDDLSFSA